MLKTKVGYSVLEDSFESGRETASKATEGMNPKLGLLYTSCVLNQEDLVKGARLAMGNAPIIGCTSSGAIMVPEGIIDQATGFSGMMVLDDPELIVGVASSARTGDPREIGRKLALDAIKDAGLEKVPAYFYMVASPAEEELYLKGIQDVLGRVPFFGGSAADNTVEGNWKIFCNDNVFSDGCAIAVFFTKGSYVTEYTGAYHESNHVGIVTEVANDRTLVTIDGISALRKYADWIGVSPNELKGSNLLAASICKPLGVKDPLGSLTVVRHPMFGDDKGTETFDDDTINLGNKVVPNTAIVQLEATVDELIHSTGETMREVKKNMNKNAAGYFLVHCGGRKLGIGDRMNEVYAEVKAEAGDVPFMMIFTFGEYGYHDHSANICGGLMLSFTGLSE
ncbi:MAG: hypothetical protein HFG15_04685 [Bacilli bacterium]|jgi:hypothetical protein|nr:hypothetical protein [Bacilli bacterium]